MTLVRCDRCKREVRGYNAKQIELKEKKRIMLVIHEYSIKKDLCEECHKELLSWIGVEI